MLNGGNFRRRVLSPAAERVGIPGFQVNDLRHSAVSFAVQLGANVYAIQRMVGHSKLDHPSTCTANLWDDSQEQLASQLNVGSGQKHRPYPLRW